MKGKKADKIAKKVPEESFDRSEWIARAVAAAAMKPGKSTKEDSAKDSVKRDSVKKN